MKIGEKNYIKQLRLHNEKALAYVIDEYGGLIMSVIRKHLFYLPEKQEATILLVSGGSKIRLRLRDLLYAETDGHYLIFHTAEGQIRQCGTISTLEADLTNKQFVRCNSCYLVNLQHIAGIKGYSLLLDNGEELKISQPRKKQVQQTYNEYLAAH